MNRRAETKWKCNKQAAFTLVEVAMALGIITFALVAVLGIFPFGLQQSAISIHSTRAAHLACTVFTTLQGLHTRNEQECFGQRLDIAALRSEHFDPAVPATIFYAKFSETEEATIGTERDTATTYRLQLWFQTSETSDATQVLLRIEPLGQSTRDTFTSILGGDE